MTRVTHVIEWPKVLALHLKSDPFTGEQKSFPLFEEKPKKNPPKQTGRPPKQAPPVVPSIPPSTSAGKAPSTGKEEEPLDIPSTTPITVTINTPASTPSGKEDEPPALEPIPTNTTSKPSQKEKSLSITSLADTHNTTASVSTTVATPKDTSITKVTTPPTSTSSSTSTPPEKPTISLQEKTSSITEDSTKANIITNTSSKENTSTTSTTSKPQVTKSAPKPAPAPKKGNSTAATGMESGVAPSISQEPVQKREVFDGVNYTLHGFIEKGKLH